MLNAQLHQLVQVIIQTVLLREPSPEYPFSVVSQSSHNGSRLYERLYQLTGGRNSQSMRHPRYVRMRWVVTPICEAAYKVCAQCAETATKTSYFCSLHNFTSCCKTPNQGVTVSIDESCELSPQPQGRHLHAQTMSLLWRKKFLSPEFTPYVPNCPQRDRLTPVYWAVKYYEYGGGHSMCVQHP
jgi:hypothetical protein